jgi:hypothetical protein
MYTQAAAFLNVWGPEYYHRSSYVIISTAKKGVLYVIQKFLYLKLTCL